MEMKEKLIRTSPNDTMTFTGEYDSMHRSIAVDSDGDIYTFDVRDSYGFDTDIYKDGKKVGYVNAWTGLIVSL